MPKIISETDLQNIEAISQTCHESNEPIFIKNNDTVDMVIMSIELYENRFEIFDLYSKIAEGENDINNGRVRDAKEVFSELESKHFEK